jgi:hypothetical protein
VGTDNFTDPYGKVASLLQSKTGVHRERKVVKTAIMTTGYNSLANPRKLFGKDYDSYMTVFGTCFSGALKVMKILNQCFDKTRDIHSWVMPDGFTVHMPTYKSQQLKHSSVWGKLDFMSHIVAPNPDQWRSLVPNVIHSIDAWLCRETIRLFQGGDIATVHDCFRVHPNDASSVQFAYNCALTNLYNSNMLEFIVRQLQGDTLVPFSYGTKERHRDILTSGYAVW